MMQVKILADDMLYPCNVKRVLGRAFKHKDWVLGCFVSGAGGVLDVSYFVADHQTGAIFGLGDSKQEALSEARFAISGFSAEQIDVLCKHHQSKVDAWHEARAEYVRVVNARHRARPRPIDRRRAEVFEKSKGQCHYCETKLDLEGKWHVEHFVPKARGGSNHIRNLVASCVDCNLEKSAKTGDEYMASLK